MCQIVRDDFRDACAVRRAQPEVDRGARIDRLGSRRRAPWRGARGLANERNARHRARIRLRRVDVHDPDVLRANRGKQRVLMPELTDADNGVGVSHERQRLVTWFLEVARLSTHWPTVARQVLDANARPFGDRRCDAVSRRQGGKHQRATAKRIRGTLRPDSALWRRAGLREGAGLWRRGLRRSARLLGKRRGIERGC
jgi:hypothetical protein